MTAMRFLTDLRERSTNLWERLSTRRQMLEMLELLNGHEKATADLLESPPTACLLPQDGTGQGSDNVLFQRFGLEKKFVRGQGYYLFDAEGARYADFTGAAPFGHDPKTYALEATPGERMPLPGTSRLAIELAQRLLAVAPAGLGHAVFTASAVEAMDLAVALAGHRTGRRGILSAEGQDAERGFDAVPFGDLGALEAALASRPNFFAAFVVEPIQSEAGINLAPAHYLAAASELCHRFGALLIVDEARLCLGRTGTCFACQSEGVTPDILVLGNALTGGVTSIGVCLCTPAVYAQHFDAPQHAGFGPNALALRAALTVIDELNREDRALVKQVRAVGDWLRGELERLKDEFPSLVAAVQGRGLLLGLKLQLDHIAKTQNGLLAVSHEQGTLPNVVLSYLLNAERISITQASGVLRIEPPLTVDTVFCTQLIDALRRLLDALQRGDAGELFAHFIKDAATARGTRANGYRRYDVAEAPVRPRLTRSENQCNRFAYVVHLLSSGDMLRLDPSLERFGDAQLEQFRKRIAGVTKPIPIDKMVVERPDGRFAEGELIVLPYLPAELLALSGKEAVDLVQSAVDLGVARGARVVGLGGFSSIISYGGNALEKAPGVTITSGNSLTAWAAMRSIEAGCAQHDVAMADCTVAILGANGAIGQALSLLFAERAGELILIGNPQNPEASVRKLRRVATGCRKHVTSLAASGRTFTPGSLAAEIVSRPASTNTHDAEIEARMTPTTDFEQCLPKAHIIVTATKSVLPFIASRHLRQGAFVCDVSRPFNILPEVMRRRRDLRRVSGGLMKAPDSSILGYIEERDRPKVLMCCAAETIMLALSGYQSEHLCGRLDINTVEEIGRQAVRFGFSVVD